MSFSNELSFSNWLAQNIEILNEKLPWDIDSTSIRREASARRVGRVDLLCQATKSDDETFNVVIENQLGRTDDNHLGRIMEYIAAFQAKAVIWIARDSAYSHRQAMRWLNESSQIDAYIFKLQIPEKGAPSLIPVIYPGAPAEANPAPAPKIAAKSGRIQSDPKSWRTKTRLWFERVLPVVAAECKPFGLWQTQTTKDMIQANRELLWVKQPVLHYDNRVNEYLAWTITPRSSDVAIGLYVPHSPRDKSRYYWDSLMERKAEMDEKFGATLNPVVLRGGFKHISWYPMCVGYENADAKTLEAGAEQIARDMADLISVSFNVIADFTPYETRHPNGSKSIAFCQTIGGKRANPHIALSESDQ